ncbi:uncharacterized protein LOC115529188 isoform X1 [Gadus morhua]|uniref:uncharacterized protein LOC115529188 isoform X1 n=1 Tax=Gadus morhua TaxID=8049 RepID=UPI0011B6F34C|nr:uncharacterized protein LOC115529188 isoform X1 [Gadus morhua]
MGLPGSPSLTDIRSAVATYNFDSEIGRRDHRNTTAAATTSASPRTAPAPRRPAPASPCCGPTGSPGPPQWCGPRRCRPAPSRCPGRNRSRTHRTSSATCCTSGGPQGERAGLAGRGRSLPL